MCKDGFKPQVIWLVKDSQGVQVGTVTGTDDQEAMAKKASVAYRLPLESLTLEDSGKRKERCGGCQQ